MADQNDVHYVLPRHSTEVDRLDIQHYAMREALAANYLAPIERPDRILDVGCGTGQWAYELCQQFPEAMVVGLDLEPSKPERPANYRFVKADLLRGLPFPDDHFDFVHQRLLQSGVPLKRWSGVVKDLVQVARPGGWIELVELKDRWWADQRPGACWSCSSSLLDPAGLIGPAFSSVGLMST